MKKFAKDKKIRKQITYIGINNQRWLMTISFDNEVTVFCNGEKRIYDIPKPIIDIKQDKEYVYLRVNDNMIYQFKFEVDNFLVGDIFENDGEHLDSFASHVFGE